MALSQAEILDAATGLLDEVGVDELSTRRLAARLGVRAGALYWHFPNKQALLDELAGRVLLPLLDLDLGATGQWAHGVAAFGGALRAAMLAHRDGARLVATMARPVATARTAHARLIDLLIGGGAQPEQAGFAADALTSYVNGYTLEEQARQLVTLSEEHRERAFATGIRVVVSGLRAELSLR